MARKLDIPFFFYILVPTFLDELAQKGLLRRLTLLYLREVAEYEWKLKPHGKLPKKQTVIA